METYYGFGGVILKKRLFYKTTYYHKHRNFRANKATKFNTNTRTSTELTHQ